MITSDRDVFIGAHLTLEQKERFRAEASKRRMSMSALLSEVVESFLSTIKTEPKEKSKRKSKNQPNITGNIKEEDIPLPFHP